MLYWKCIVSRNNHFVRYFNFIKPGVWTFPVISIQQYCLDIKQHWYQHSYFHEETELINELQNFIGHLSPQSKSMCGNNITFGDALKILQLYILARPCECVSSGNRQTQRNCYLLMYIVRTYSRASVGSYAIQKCTETTAFNMSEFCGTVCVAVQNVFSRNDLLRNYCIDTSRSSVEHTMRHGRLYKDPTDLQKSMEDNSAWMLQEDQQRSSINMARETNSSVLPHSTFNGLSLYFLSHSLIFQCVCLCVLHAHLQMRVKQSVLQW